MSEGNLPYYKHCIVLECQSNSKNAPDKLFIRVPQELTTRNLWLRRGGRHPEELSEKSTLYFCEDHFDLPNDMDNFMRYKIQGSVKRIRMKKDCVPSKFDCQSKKRIIAPIEESPDMIKKRRKEIVEEILKEDKEKEPEKGLSEATTSAGSLVEVVEIGTPPAAKTKSQDKSVQVQIYCHKRTKGTQTANRYQLNKAVSPIKIKYRNTSTSPLKFLNRRHKMIKIKRRLFQGKPDTSESEFSSPTKIKRKVFSSQSEFSSPSKSAQSVAYSGSDDNLKSIEADVYKKQALETTMRRIKLKPRFYVGIPKSSFYLVDIIEQKCHIPKEHILLCLKKIRLDTKFSELGDEFGFSLSYASKIFLKTIPVLAQVLKRFLVNLQGSNTRKKMLLNLPIAFRHKYRNVSCIIDCLEIEIQKPSQPIKQTLTWSDYKKGNTMKYLISSTPDGLAHYVSPGYGGRITDVLLVEKCCYLDLLPPGACILADRGFKHLELLLAQKGLKLIRPPSVYAGETLTKSEVKGAKQVASLRIHIERVVRRVREFLMCEPHSGINLNLIRVLNDVVVIACGLINLQDSLIRA